MAHDVFVCHASVDKATADAVVATLEQQQIRCWVAPRDAILGTNYGASIVQAINNSRVMVLVFSSDANNSPHVPREIERAANKGIPILPLRIEDVSYSDSIEYFISTTHWLDALTPPLQQHLETLARSVRALLATDDPRQAHEQEVEPTAPVPVPAPTELPSAPADKKSADTAGGQELEQSAPAPVPAPTERSSATADKKSGDTAGGPARSRMGAALSVITRQQTYVNVFYLLLSFPLGIGYFVFLVTGLSVGFGLLVIWVGVPILALVLAGSWVLSRLEQEIANRVLRLDIPSIIFPRTSNPLSADATGLGFTERVFARTWRQVKALLSDRLTWTGMVYLFLKFPLGVASFVIVVTLASVTASLLGAPFYYWVGDGIDFGIWQVDQLWEALILMLAGVPSLFISLHLFNATAYVSGRIARVMLAKSQ